MTSLTDLIDRFYDSERVAGNILDKEDVLAKGVAVALFHAGYSDLKTHLDIPIADPAPDPPTPYPEITNVTELSISEWSLMRPLFLLYVERENAIQLEASRGMGVDVFGRSSSEIIADITLAEENYPKKAFSSLIITV